VSLRRADFLRGLALALAWPAGVARAAAGKAPALTGLRVENRGHPFAGDRRLLTTVSRNRERDTAVVHFTLRTPADLLVEAIRTDTVKAGEPHVSVVWRERHRLGHGPHRLAWTPARSLPPRTYILRLTVSANGDSRQYGAYRPGRPTRVDAPVVRVLGVDVATTKASYAPGEAADLVVATDAQTLRAQVFRYAGGGRVVERDLRTNAVAVTPAATVDWRSSGDRPARLRLVRAGGDWPSGLYFVRLTASDGRSGYAPFIVRPRSLGTNRVAVVLSTNTWQAYNFYDADGDGWGDSWYVSGATRAVDVTRPYLDFGLPFRFRDWDLTFLAWLNRSGRRVDFLSDGDLEAVGTGERLRNAYDLVVFPGHEEYVTERAYDIVQRYRDLGGHLIFLSANNFFRRVVRDGRRLVRAREWRHLGRPEAGLVGVQYVGSDPGGRQAPFVVTGAAAVPWLFEGTGLGDGDTFGRYGIEIDARGALSPDQTIVLARIPDLMGPGRSAEMTLYDSPSGGTVFAAGALNFAASLEDGRVARLVDNLWRRLAGD
jgi:N,N-dimethylformamidase beta subunit-like, C-terminal